MAEFLAVHHQPGIGVQAGQMFTSHAEHAAGACGGVLQAAHHARLGQGRIVFNEQQGDFARFGFGVG